MAARIGALNTLVRSPKGQLHGHNTDWSAAIGAIEQGLSEHQGTAGALSDAQPSSSPSEQGELPNIACMPSAGHNRTPHSHVPINKVQDIVSAFHYIGCSGMLP